MKLPTIFKLGSSCIALFFLTVACNQSTADETLKEKTETSQATTTNVDPVQLKSEIQELETAWANADNARDADKLAAFYSEDAISMANNQPMLVGNAAIKKDMEASIAKRAKGATISYDVLEVYGSGNYVTEIGKTTRKDADGKVMTTGKYMAIWEKRDGKWICIRDIGNEDAKEK